MASLRLQDKVAIVTGSSSGLGRAIALRYSREGAKVVCSDLSPVPRLQVDSESEPTHELITKAGGTAIFVQTDVGDAKQMESLVQEAVREFGRLDILVNNAGIALEARTPAVCHLTDESVWDTTMTVNAKSVFLGCKYALAQMLEQPPHFSGDRGWIVNISSIMGIIGALDNPSYCASKGAVSNLTRQVALDYAPHKIRVNAICPGCMDAGLLITPPLTRADTRHTDTQTAIFKETTTHMTPWDDLKRRHPLNGPGLPEDIAKVAVVLASDDASWMTGVSLPVDGGYTAR